MGVVEAARKRLEDQCEDLIFQLERSNKLSTELGIKNEASLEVHIHAHVGRD